MPILFLSYTKKDRILANRIAIDLRHAGRSVWHDESENLLGHDVLDPRYDGIRNSHFLAFLITTDFVESTWVREQLNETVVQQIEKNGACIIPLLFQNCPTPDALKGEHPVDFRASYEKGLDQLLRVVTMTAFPKELAEKKTELEGLFISKKDDVESLARLMLTPEKGKNEEIKLSEHFADKNIATLEATIHDCISILDHLISIEDSESILLDYYSEARELSAMILDYNKESLYFAYLLENSPVTIHNLIMQGIASANAGLKERAINSFRSAIRLFCEAQNLSPDDPETWEASLIKLVYTITRHIRVELTYAKLYRNLIMFRDKVKLIERLGTVMDCFDEALERESVFTFEKESSCFNYGKLLAVIGLTKRALVYLRKAQQLGSTEAEFVEAGIDITALEEGIETMERSKRQGGEQTLHITPIQLPNFFLQFGQPPQEFEEVIKKAAPEFFKEVIEDYEVFEKPRS